MKNEYWTVCAAGKKQIFGGELRAEKLAAARSWGARQLGAADDVSEQVFVCKEIPKPGDLCELNCVGKTLKEVEAERGFRKR